MMLSSHFISGLLLILSIKKSSAAFSQSEESLYLDNFDTINSASYSAVDDPDSSAPKELIETCKKGNISSNANPPTIEILVNGGGNNNGIIDSNTLSRQCGMNSICVIPSGTALHMDSNVNVGALIVRGTVEWNDSTQKDQSLFLCAGYVAVESQGRWSMNLQQKNGWIYIKENRAVHPMLRERAFGAAAGSHTDNPIVDIEGRDLKRTWSLLSEPLDVGDNKMKLLHNPSLMGWRVGDRISIAPTESHSKGFGEEFRIVAIEQDATLVLNKSAQSRFNAEFLSPLHGGQPSLMSAEVMNLDRNIVITGDDFTHVPCDSALPEAVAGEQTSVKGCRCSSFRNKCTVGLHQIQMHGGIARIKNTRVEKCGQRGIEGKYCLHFHMLGECPQCIFKNNAVENSHQRGIIVHGTHLSKVEENVLYNVRGAGIYIEDGNEMYNDIKYNVVVCPFPFRDQNLHGCTVPGTSNSIADTSDNQAGIFTRAATNNLIGNRCANSFNGMLLQGGGIGRGNNSYDKVCEPDAKFGRFEGNTFHGHLRFGTYTLGFNYPKVTDQSISTDGHNINKDLCRGFDNDGNTRGLPVAFKDNLDYQNVFVGHYEAGDIQYQGHQSYDNDNLIYWKETKNFEGGCSAHITGSQFARGQLALPDMGTFIIDESSFGIGVKLEPNHHCNVGMTGGLCMPQYILHHVSWLNTDRTKKWVEFQNINTQSHGANQNHGGIFSLSPSDAATVISGDTLENSFLPPGFVSLVSSKFWYLLTNDACISSTSLGDSIAYIYDGGILCRLPLRALKVYSKGLNSRNAPKLVVETWFNGQGILGQNDAPYVVQEIDFHQVGDDDKSTKQGYSLPVIPGLDQSYRLSLTGDNPIPQDWVVEFSDWVVGNRWNVEYIYLSLVGRSCGTNGLVSSHHDRKFIWSGDEFMQHDAWGNHGACVHSNPPDMPQVDCTKDTDNGVILPTECPSSLCGNSCTMSNSYCDCGTATCRCKAGFTGEDCSIDLCAAAGCGDHGTCAAKYLGSSLPITSNKACICDSGWAGHLCQFNPCLGQGKTCSNHGTCVADGINSATCECEAGYSGDNCEVSCEDQCIGTYPFGCATNVPNKVAYGCNSSGQCNYLSDGENYPQSGFCTYKKEQQINTCNCDNHNDCQNIPCDSNGICGDPVIFDDFTRCHSVPFGICMGGKCTEPSSPPISNPAPSPSSSPPEPTKCSCLSCTNDVLTAMSNGYQCGNRIDWLVNNEGLGELDACRTVSNQFPAICGPCHPDQCGMTASPTQAPSKRLTLSPTKEPTKPTNCGCEQCTNDVLSAMAGGHSCKDRIDWLINVQQNSELNACMQVSKEYTDICGSCNPDHCGITVAPTAVPSKHPTRTPTNEPTTSAPNPCGCEACSNQILNTMAGDYSCRSRIKWLQDTQGISEQESCIQISNTEFPLICGPSCDPLRCLGGRRRRYLRSEE